MLIGSDNVHSPSSTKIILIMIASFGFWQAGKDWLEVWIQYESKNINL